MNLVEHAPLALFVIAIAELNGAPSIWVHSLGGALVVARTMHPFGHPSRRHHPSSAPSGAMLTALVTLLAAIVAIRQRFHVFA